MECVKCKNKIEKKKRKPKPFKYPIIDNKKECSNCHDSLDIEYFNINTNGRRKAICKKCQSIKNAEYYHNKKISIIEDSINKS